MPPDNSSTVSVIDFRRQSMILQWHILGGTWSTYDVPPSLVHGVALIRAAQPNICVYGQDGRLRLQVGADQFELSENSPHIKCTRGLASFGHFRRFTVESGGEVLFSQAYWTGQGDDFFSWLAARAQHKDWGAKIGRQWSEGLAAAVLRSG